MAGSSRNVPQIETPSDSQSPSSVRPKFAAQNRTTTSRLPPPTLFKGPPSKNASHISLVLPDESQRKEQNAATRSGALPRPSRVPPATSFSGSSFRHPSTHVDEFRAESHWAEMQKTLADVELSAMNPSHVFGAEHAKALEDLRTAQLSLAQAWARSEAEEITEHEGHDPETRDVSAGVNVGLPGSGRGSRRNSTSIDRTLEQETERDIQLARRRREANDRYFQQVNQGVLEVVQRLDEVAGAMRRVERESREIWNDDDSALSAGEADLISTESGGIPETPTDASASVMADSPVSFRTSEDRYKG